MALFFWGYGYFALCAQYAYAARLFRALRSIRLRGAAISRFALNTPTRRGYFALCAQYTALIGYWLTPIRLLSPYLALYRTQYGLWLRLFRALRSIRLRGAAISRLSPDISHQCPIFLTLRGSKTNHYSASMPRIATSSRLCNGHRRIRRKFVYRQNYRILFNTFFVLSFFRFQFSHSVLRYFPHGFPLRSHRSYRPRHYMAHHLGDKRITQIEGI